MYAGAPACGGSITWWLKWQMGQVTGEQLSWRCDAGPIVVPITSAKSRIGITTYQIDL